MYAPKTHWHKCPCVFYGLFAFHSSRITNKERSRWNGVMGLRRILNCEPGPTECHRQTKDCGHKQSADHG
jgi:hypothetical protein